MSDLENELSEILLAYGPLAGMLVYIIDLYADGGLTREEMLEQVFEALIKDGYKKTKYKWEYDQEGDMHEQ